jgi:dCMP deaminase
LYGFDSRLQHQLNIRMAKQSKLNEVYLNMAQELSTLSYAKRKKVGCLIVKETQIISEGYNGTPKGFDNSCEYYDYVEEMYTKPEVLHAESNAITKLARSTNSSSGSTLYVTLAPCYECSKLIIQAGIKEVFFREKYKNDGLLLLNKAGVDTYQLPRKEK